jgi:hypothetical protein
MSSDLVSRLLEAIEETAQDADQVHTMDCLGVYSVDGERPYACDCGEPSSVLLRCAEDRALVDWYVGWQETFRGPIPEGHTEEGALHFRMASEFVFNRLLASYGIDWADDGGITEEET